MSFLIANGSSLVLIVAVTVAIFLAVAAVILLREGLKAQRRIADLEAEVERQGDSIWELRDSEERTRSLIDGQGDLIVRRDVRGRIVYANDAFATLAGTPREALADSSFVFEVVEAAPIEVREDGITRRDEAIRTTQGIRWIEWQDVAVRGALRSQPEIQSVGRDVTARREAERTAAKARDEAEATNRAKSRFLATVSHEIRTPLGGALGMADLLLESSLSPAQATYAKAIKTSGEALLSLIDEILDFSKIEAGRLDLDERPFAPRTLVEDVVELLSPRAHAKGLDIAATVAPEVPAHVFGDGGRLKQVILNLAGNAIKFTETGGVLVRLVMAERRLAFSVTDTGIGIAPDQVGRIFDEFEQADSTPARRYGGTGLGLAISQRLVGRMGGTITVDSLKGRGSTFAFSLPLAAAPGPALPVANPKGRRILIASPSAVTGQALGTMLVDFHVEAVLETVAEAARERIARESFDVVLADRAFGLDECSAIATAGLGAGCRVVALVTPAERHEIAKLTTSGAAGYLVKPIRAASLMSQVAGTAATQPANDDVDRPIERPLKGVSALLAEDNDINALVARTVLMKLGATVAWAKDGAEAIRLFVDARFDAILMDLHMPGLDGLSATRQIREQEAATGAIPTPIYALTANASTEDRELCLAAGMDDYLTKPLDRDALIGLLGRFAKKPSPKRREKLATASSA